MCNALNDNSMNEIGPSSGSEMVGSASAALDIHAQWERYRSLIGKLSEASGSGDATTAAYRKRLESAVGDLVGSHVDRAERLEDIRDAIEILQQDGLHRSATRSLRSDAARELRAAIRGLSSATEQDQVVGDRDDLVRNGRPSDVDGFSSGESSRDTNT